MIEAGIKPEEYRAIKAYYISRLTDQKPNWKRPRNQWKFIKFDAIEFSNGYGKKVPKLLVEHLGTNIGNTNPDWADGWEGEAFVLNLGKILSRVN